ncbi:efflux RND transporter periplasmic adaptor subunit [Paremcibacter congregatus]|uniref:efflux RND transporter periplasmic adaptor subunit n=1 Tax=Paremcibacter congregatus TaxID=2043170 RepID=UPI003A8E6D45
MDIAITKKKVLPVKRYVLIALAAAVTLAGGRYLWILGQADFSIARDSLVISEVRNGPFTVSVRGTGVLAPDNIQWLSAAVEAKVVRLVVKPGNLVKTGDLIVILDNPQLIQKLAETQWELEAQDAELQAGKTAQESLLLEQKISVLNAKLDYESSLLTYQAQGELFHSQSPGAVSKITFEKSRLETDQLKRRWQISEQRRIKMEENLAAQHNARLARLSKTKKMIERMMQQVDNLNVRASMDSIVLEVPLEPGQSIVTGANIAKLALQDSLIAELQVPEIMIGEVAVGQRVVIDTRNNKMTGAVTRIDPAVINGTVQVDVSFADGLPADARPDLSVDGEIIVTELAEALHVDRPLFAQSKSRMGFYKISDDGQFAARVDVNVGFGSVNKIQILGGLKAGDRIITSDTTPLESYQKVRIK